MVCKGRSEEDEFEFRSCASTPNDEMVKLIIFQACMALLGGKRCLLFFKFVTDLLIGLAFWGVQIRKKQSQSLFDNRKQKYTAYSSPMK